MSITNKGIINSIDSLFSFVIISIMLLLILLTFSRITEKQLEDNKRKELELYAIYLADSLVKNSDENGLTGIAYFDKEKHRVKSNEIEEEKITGLKNNEMIYSAWIKEKNGEEKKFFEKGSGKKECVSVERPVLIHNRVVLFGVKTCE